MNKRLALIITALILLAIPIVYASLSCSVTTSCSYTDVMHLSATSDAHGELNSGSDYPYEVCCQETGGATLTTTCGTELLHLSDVTDAHAELANESDYSYNVCLDSPNGTISCSYGASCSGYDTCLVSLSTNIVGGYTDLHLADCITDPYDTFLCCNYGIWNNSLTDRANDANATGQWDLKKGEKAIERNGNNYSHHKIIFQDTTLNTSWFNVTPTGDEYWLKLIFFDGDPSNHSQWWTAPYYCGYVFYNKESINDARTHIAFTYTVLDLANNQYACDGKYETPITDVDFDFNYSNTRNEGSTTNAKLTIDTVQDYIDYAFNTDILPESAILVAAYTGQRGAGVLNDRMTARWFVTHVTEMQGTAAEAHLQLGPGGYPIPEFPPYVPPVGIAAIIIIIILYTIKHNKGKY